MKSASAGTIAILGGDQMYMADCYTFTLVDGTVLRYTTADKNITDAGTGHVFLSSGPLFERSKIRMQTGVQVDEMDIVLTAGPNDLIGTTPWLAAIGIGVLDGAEVQLDRAFMSTFGDTSAGLVTMFAGRVVEVDSGRTQATIKVNTHLELLSLQLPWRLFQPGCAWTLFSNRCALTKASFASAKTVSGVSPGSNNLTQFLITISGDAHLNTAGYFTFGTATFTSGALSGKSYSIKQHYITTISGTPVAVMVMLVPMLSIPAASDGVTIYPGCDKTQNTCNTKFSNLAHFGGMPYVPVPETAA